MNVTVSVPGWRRLATGSADAPASRSLSVAVFCTTSPLQALLQAAGLRHASRCPVVLYLASGS